MTDFWLKSQFRLWHVRPAQVEWRTYLTTTQLIHFETGGDAPLKTCPYCGSVSTNGKGNCSQCGGPLGRLTGKRIGSMDLAAIMPFDADTLTTLHSGDRIELHHSVCGRVDDYTTGHIVAVLIVDDIEGPCFDNLACWNGNAYDSATILVRVSGPVGLDFKVRDDIIVETWELG